MAYLRDAGKLPTGEVGEAQIVEAGRDGGIVLDERPPHRVPGELLVDQRVVAQQLGMTQMQVSRAERRLLSALKERLQVS